MLSFENTQVAFKSKTNKELRRARFLFGILGRKWMVNMGKQMTLFSLAIRLPIQGLIKKTIFKQFVGGTSIEDCETNIALLHQYKVGTILDYSVEGKETEDGFDNAEQEIIKTIKKANADDRIPFCVFKVSGLGRHAVLEKRSDEKISMSKQDEKEWEAVVARVQRICKEAFDANQPIFIDAEESWIQPAIDELALKMIRAFNKEACIVYNTVQLYRHDRLDYIHELYDLMVEEDLFLGLKLVRGAYMEKERERALEKGYEDPIQPNKETTDKDFDAAASFCFERIDRIGICLGTHNEKSSALIAEHIAQSGLPINHSHIYFAQLLGMSDHISFNLSNAGFNVAKYVPYGPVREVVPYLFRRAEENTSVKGQTGRELSLINQEIKRRKM